jgi:hypothetical protein
MKFIKLESRGGNYLVVAENVAWLRTAENGQTNIGIIGSQPLLVVGSIEEVAATILAATSGSEAAPPAPPVTSAKPQVQQSKVEPQRADPAEQWSASESPRPISRQGATLSERVAAAAGTKVKAGSQRFMGSLD